MKKLFVFNRLYFFRKNCFYFFANVPEKSSPEMIVSSPEFNKEIAEKSFNQTENMLKSLKETTAGKSFSEISKDLVSPINIEMDSQNKNLMIENPIAGNKYLQTNQNDIASSFDVIFRVAENEKAGQLLSKKEFDLMDPNLDIQSSTQSGLFLSKESNFKQFSVGNVELLSKNSVSLADVDLNNIPKNLDIQIFPNKREVLVIGKEIGNIDGTEQEKVEKVDNEIFVEKSFEDVEKEELNFAERLMLLSNPISILYICFLTFPVTLFLYFYIRARLEFQECVEIIVEIDEQNMKAFNNLTRKFDDYK